MWGKIIIPMYRIWLNGLYGLYGPRCPLFSKRPINLISLSLSLFSGLPPRSKSTNSRPSKPQTRTLRSDMSSTSDVYKTHSDTSLSNGMKNLAIRTHSAGSSTSSRWEEFDMKMKFHECPFRIPFSKALYATKLVIRWLQHTQDQ